MGILLSLGIGIPSFAYATFYEFGKIANSAKQLSIYLLKIQHTHTRTANLILVKLNISNLQPMKPPYTPLTARVMLM